MASTAYTPRGHYRDRLITAPGRVLDRGWQSNLVVDRARVLIAGFMRGDGPGGVERLLVGRGDASWDTTPPAAPPHTTQQLVDPSPFEVVVNASQIEYLDATGQPTTDPTHRLRIVITLGENEPASEDPYPLREFGLFGRFSSEGYMINYVRHAVLHKQASDTLERTIQLIF